MDFADAADADKVMDRINTGEAKLREQSQRIDVLHSKVRAYKFPMQELKLQYGQNKGKSYSEEEDRFLLVRMHHHGIDRDDCYELIKRDIGEWPLFRWVLLLSNLSSFSLSLLSPPFPLSTFLTLPLNPLHFRSCPPVVQTKFADRRFDWFFKSRTPEELRRRGATLLLCIMKDKDLDDDKSKAKGGKVSQLTVTQV